MRLPSGTLEALPLYTTVPLPMGFPAEYEVPAVGAVQPLSVACLTTKTFLAFHGVQPTVI